MTQQVRPADSRLPGDRSQVACLIRGSRAVNNKHTQDSRHDSVGRTQPPYDY